MVTIIKDNPVPKTQQKKRLQNINLPTNIGTLPLPSSGTWYTPIETVNLLKNYPDKSKTKARFINHLIAAKRVPMDRPDTIYKLLRKETNGEREEEANC